MDEIQDLNKIKAFLTRGRDETHYNKLQAHILYGWRWNTVLLYNGAVRKFLKFKSETSPIGFELPATVRDIYDFCVWAGRTRDGPSAEDVLSVTVSKYLHGLKVWHLYHLEEYPPVNDGVIKQILTASKRIDSTLPKKEGKKPVYLKHLVHLAVELSKMGEKELAILDTVLVAFWGLARLGELSGDKHEKSDIVKVEDVEMTGRERVEARIIIRGAKTASAGVTQILQLKELNHLLCPIAAIRRRLARSENPEDALFSYTEGKNRVTLEKKVIIATCQKCWESASYKGLTGHSFRVGGASFRFALGVKIDDICEIGRWKSEAYRLYVKAYSKKDLSETLVLLNDLENNKLH